MSVVATWRAGMTRVRRAPAMLLVLWLVSLSVTVPPAIALYAAIETHLGSSLEATTAADGVNYDWLQEFQAQAGPLGRTLRADVIGFAAVLDNTSALADSSKRPFVVVASGIVFLLLTWFFTPGITCRLAVGRRLGAGGFMAVCGACLGRIVRLNAVSMVFYGALVGSFHRWLFDDLLGALTRDVTVERTAFILRLACYAVFFGLLAICNLVFDMAKVRLVVEDRRSVLAAVMAALDFVVSNVRLCVGTYAANLLTLAGVVALYGVLSPGVGGTGAGMWLTLLLGQLYVIARIFVKLAFWSSAIVALQTRLAYDGFVRRLPDPAPPISEMLALDEGVGATAEGR